MDKFSIIGGKPLHGEVNISGAKNAALPILFATLLTDEACTVHNIPQLRDIESTTKVLRILGAHIEKKEHVITVEAKQLSNAPQISYDLVRTMRASILTLGPLLARLGTARVSLPGGCAIGSRPVDIHIDGLVKMGAKIKVENGYIQAHCKQLRGAEINLSKVSVTATENLMMAATLAKGETILHNAAREPEVVDLACFLNAMGANIKGAGSDTVIISGDSQLHGANYTVMFDRIEAGTFMAALAACGGEIVLHHVQEEYLQNIIPVFSEGGMKINFDGEHLYLSMPKRFQSIDIETAAYPGFPTDLQAQLMVVNCVSNGRSAITETIFENRFMHVQELIRMGAIIELRHNTAIVTGVSSLQGAPVMATDLRASASLVIAGLVAKEKTVVTRIYHLDRGYESMEKKLRALNANVRRLSK